ncbi:hypothetical protein [Aliiglaciecola sp. M165]|uniref:hypothetical protein n=1 Tax=Aliiglaciecola sp. M165 TaxID=2593649 RepID=UPI00117D9EFA|nr:hypothetical protein [Aliiglaciecola sp. M165]TRY33314.1 hypothetical protein FM019_04865 [Aliiglaciecola sp. M165]
MNVLTRKLLLTGILLTAAQLSVANTLSFSLGTGYPFFVVPEVSLSSADNSRRWHLNYKAGLDDGFTIGVEQVMFDSQQHAMGAVIGAIGIREEDTPCDDIPSNVGCIVATIFDEETVNGAAISYGYYFNGLNSSGWHVKFEAGYGEGSQSKEKRASASIRLSYQF